MRLTPFALENYVEAGFWSAIGVGFAIAAGRRALRKAARICILVAMTLVIFGLSDVVEAQTGAWWRPWWLFAWKAICVAALLAAFIEYRRRKLRGPS